MTSVTVWCSAQTVKLIRSQNRLGIFTVTEFQKAEVICT